MHRRIILLNAAVVPASKQVSLTVEQRCAYGYAAFGQSTARFFDGDS
jgi:hypothetical protein